MFKTNKALRKRIAYLEEKVKQQRESIDQQREELHKQDEEMDRLETRWLNSVQANQVLEGKRETDREMYERQIDDLRSERAMLLGVLDQFGYTIEKKEQD